MGSCGWLVSRPLNTRLEVASTTRCINIVTERITTTAPRPPSTHHVRQVQSQVTGDQPKNWRRPKNRSPTAGTCVETRRQARRREEHQIRIDVDGVSSVNTKSLDSAAVHVGKDDLDVGTEDQAARLRRVEDAREDSVADHKKCDSEYQDQLPNTGDSVAAIQEESTSEFDDDDSSSFRLYRSGVPTATSE